MEVALGIIIYQNKVLLIKRVKEEGNLLWAFPGGKKDVQDNSIEATVVREVREETGANVLAKNLIASRKFGDVKLSYFECEFISQSSGYSQQEIQEIRFCSVEEMLSLVTSEIFPPVLEFIRNKLK